MKESKEAVLARKITVEYEQVMNRMYALTERLRDDERATVAAARVWCAAVDVQRRLHALYDAMTKETA